MGAWEGKVQGEREEGEGVRGWVGKMPTFRHFLYSRNTNHLLDNYLHSYFLIFFLGNFCVAMSKDTNYSLDDFCLL